eukprot:2273447-Rhodomonas_salina.2
MQCLVKTSPHQHRASWSRCGGCYPSLFFSGHGAALSAISKAAAASAMPVDIMRAVRTGQRQACLEARTAPEGSSSSPSCVVRSPGGCTTTGSTPTCIRTGAGEKGASGDRTGDLGGRGDRVSHTVGDGSRL